MQKHQNSSKSNVSVPKSKSQDISSSARQYETIQQTQFRRKRSFLDLKREKSRMKMTKIKVNNINELERKYKNERKLGQITKSLQIMKSKQQHLQRRLVTQNKKLQKIEKAFKKQKRVQSSYIQWKYTLKKDQRDREQERVAHIKNLRKKQFSSFISPLNKSPNFFYQSPHSNISNSILPLDNNSRTSSSFHKVGDAELVKVERLQNRTKIQENKERELKKSQQQAQQIYMQRKHKNLNLLKFHEQRLKSINQRIRNEADEKEEKLLNSFKLADNYIETEKKLMKKFYKVNKKVNQRVVQYNRQFMGGMYTLKEKKSKTDDDPWIKYSQDQKFGVSSKSSPLVQNRNKKNLSFSLNPQIISTKNKEKKAQKRKNVMKYINKYAKAETMNGIKRRSSIVIYTSNNKGIVNHPDQGGHRLIGSRQVKDSYSEESSMGEGAKIQIKKVRISKSKKRVQQ